MFHGKAEVDGAGRSWLEPPRDRKLRRPDGDYCFLPKRWIHTWAGHTKGVNAIRFFPATGHLLLSAGLDGKVKIWDVFGSGKCMRTYLGFSKARGNPARARLRACAARVPACVTHSRASPARAGLCALWQCPHERDARERRPLRLPAAHGCGAPERGARAQGVRDINFSNDGRRFLSSSYDKVVKLWDTETGQVITSLGEGKMFFCAKFHPDDSKQNVVMGGCQDKKVYQWDSNTGDLVQARAPLPALPAGARPPAGCTAPDGGSAAV